MSRCCSSLSVDSFPLVLDSSPACKDDLKASYKVHGAVESISPVSVVPCTVGSSTSGTGGGGSSNLRGFLVQILACECKLCKSKESAMGFHDSIQGQNKSSHSFTKLVIVYFCGSASSWHPVMTKLVGYVVSLSGLKKKMVFVGKEESQLMYVTTEKAFLHVPVLLNRYLPCGKAVIKGKGECASYTGIVKGIYMQGMVVELDKEVWLLLTDRSLNPPHSLRVGAFISVNNVHFVNPKFSWTKMLILGACSKTSINVESFSPSETAGHIVTPSQSLLMKYVDSLAFSARLWVLLVVSCFRKKLAGFISEQEILGSKHKEGLVQMYANSKLPSSVLQSRHGVFMEFCRHELSGCGSEPNYVHPKLVLPISYFVSHFEVTHTEKMLHFEKECEKMGNTNQVSILSCEGRSYRQKVKKNLSSEDRGIILVGSLKISPSSGKLQLVDASGGIDVLIPDLPSFWNTDSIYEVDNYKLVMENIPEQVDHSGLIVTESFSCRRIFHSFPVAKETNLVIYLCFHLQNSSCKNGLIHPRIDWKEDFEKLVSGTFHLLRVTHKFPLLQKFQGDQVTSEGSSTFAEAIVLPWDFLLGGKDKDAHPAKVFEDGSRNYQDYVPCKRRKVEHASSDRSGVMNNQSDVENESGGLLKYCSRLYKICSGVRKRWSGSSLLKIPCLATIIIGKNHNMVNSGFLYSTEATAKVGIGCKTNAQKVLLEFKSESYVKYLLLEIGGYYMTKCYNEDICNPKDSDIVGGVKVLVTSEIYLWSLCFSSQELPSYIDPSHDPMFRESSINKYESRPDVNIHSSAKVLLEIDLKLLKEGLIKRVTREEEVVKASRYDTTMTTSIRPSGTGCLLPEGNLISLNGHVLMVHQSDCNSLDAHLSHENLGSAQHLKYSEGTRSSIIYVSMGHRIVRILGSLCKNAYPIGFGPGVDAAFYRILQLGQNDFMLTAVSYIVISSIAIADSQNDHKYSNLRFASSLYNAAFLDTVYSSRLISDIIQGSECKPMQFRSRVLSIHILVLEKKNTKNDDPQPSIPAKLSFSIPLAGFVLDDGSSLCCCWASSDRAATFLRLHEEITPKAFGSSCSAVKGSGTDGACSTAFHYVDKVLEKYGKIIVKNLGSTIDSSCQDLTFSVSSDDAFRRSDENLLKTIFSNACFGTIWQTCLGKVMDSNAIGWLEEQLTEMEMVMLSLPNIWVGDVCSANSLAEARNVIQELQNG